MDCDVVGLRRSRMFPDSFFSRREHCIFIDRIVETLHELGPGFAFVGRQVHFEVGDDGYGED